MRRRWWLAGLAALVVVPLGLSAWPGAGQSQYRRYVSPPLDNGTRVTFLYPAFLGSARALPITSGPPVWDTRVLRVSVGRPESPWGQLPALRRIFGDADAEQVELIVTPPPPLMPLGLAPERAQRFERVDSKYLSGSTGSHEAIIDDSRTCFVYQIYHSYRGPRSRRQFDQDDTAITSSFQALSPGTPVPSPESAFQRRQELPGRHLVRFFAESPKFR